MGLRREKFESVCMLGRIIGSKKLNRHKKKGRRERRRMRGKLARQILGEAPESAVWWRMQKKSKTERF